jgi:hypothetical protein
MSQGEYNLVDAYGAVPFMFIDKSRGQLAESALLYK